MAAAADTDLFSMAAGPMLTEKQHRRLRKSPQARGYAAMPGSGPEGETCKSCKHYVAGRYRKCGLMKRLWTRGAGTDILARTPACREWQVPALQEERAA